MDKDTAQKHFDAYTEWVWDRMMNVTNEQTAEFFSARGVSWDDMKIATVEYHLRPTKSLLDLKMSDGNPTTEVSGV